MKINIQETFQDTLQGEGYHSGRPCDFIRLYGCPVGCSFCDTGYAYPDGEWYKRQIPKTTRTKEELLAELKSDYVVISGGEPFIHQNLPELCRALIDIGKDVGIETSGSFWQSVPEEVFITLSPKFHISPNYPVLDVFWKRANEFKLVISKGGELDCYLDKLQDFNGFLYLQPEYDDFKNSIQKTLSLLKTYNDFKLSLQIHKILNIQ